jgi:hypothetical protein
MKRPFGDLACTRAIPPALLIALFVAGCGGSERPSTATSNPDPRHDDSRAAATQQQPLDDGGAPGPTPALVPRSAEPIYFADISRAAGLAAIKQSTGAEEVDYVVDAKGAGGAWLDYDGDGDPDLYLGQGGYPGKTREGPPDQLLRNDGDPDRDGVPTFTDVTETAGLGDRLRTYGVAVADYDNDGDPDIYLTNWGPNKLYRNMGDGRFTEIGQASGVADERWSVTGVWGDPDRDGDLDLYVTNYVEFDFERYPARGEQPAGDTKRCMWHGLEIYCGPRNLEPAADSYYRNDGDPDGDGIPNFTEAIHEVGLATEEHFYALSAHFFDADNDGDDDLYVANDSVQNSFFLNRGDGTFEDLSILAGLAYSEQGHEQAGMGISTGDYDGDGLLDLVVTNFSHEHDTLYRNEGDLLFTDVSYVAGLGTPSYLTTGFGAAFIDVDHDGREDLLIAHGHVYPQVDAHDMGVSFKQQNGVFRNRGDGTLADVSQDAGPGLAIVKSSRAVLPVDLEGDGDIDILFTNLSDSPDLLRNDGSVGAWLQVRLEGRSSNRDGIGARVTLEAAGRTQIREIRRTSLYEGSTLPIAHFGLGGADVVERLEVRWPSGAVSVDERIPVNRRLTIVEK